MRRDSSRNEAGIALVLTLWVITILMVTATYFTYERKWDSRVASYYKESTFSYYLAKSAVAKTRAILADETESDAQEGLEFENGTFALPEEEYGGGTMSAVVSDLEGKVNINRAPLEMVRSLLVNTGSEYEEAERLADCIMDWRDADSEPRVNGAEDEDYVAAGRPYQSKDGPFDSNEELLLVLGMTNEIFYGDSALAALRGEPYDGGGKYLGLQNYVTVYGRGRINVNSADMRVLECVPGIDEEMARYVVNKRALDNKEFVNVSEVTRLLSEAGGSGELSRSFRTLLSVHSYYLAVDAVGTIGETETKLRAVIYRYGKNSRILPRIVAWQEVQ